jgi:transposase
MIDMGIFSRVIVYHKHGMSKREIARKLGISRNTVKKYLRQEHPPAYSKRKSKGTKLEPYKKYVSTKLAEAEYTASRLYREIKGMGYSGKYTILAEYVSKVREKRNREAIERFETVPGKQAQLDWGEVWMIEPDGSRKKRYFLLVVLGYSRMKYLEFTDDKGIYSFLRCLRNAFEYFKGVPFEVLLDNMKTAVLGRENGKIIFHSMFHRFAAHYGFIPKPGIPRKPRTRGKVENGVGFVKRDFYMGRETLPTHIVNAEARVWMENEVERISAAHRQVIGERFKEEKLLPLPVTPYDIVRIYQRRVDKCAFFSFEGNYYSVPYQYAYKRIEVRVRGEYLAVFFKDKIITSHRISHRKGERITEKDHYRMERRSRGRTSTEPVKISQLLPHICGELNLVIPTSEQFTEVEKRPVDFYQSLINDGSSQYE